MKLSYHRLLSVGGYVIGAGVHLYMYYVHMRPQKSLNGTLAVNSPFQTLVVDFSSNLYTRSTNARFRNAFLVVNHGFPYLMHTCSICPKDDTITVAESHR